MSISTYIFVFRFSWKLRVRTGFVRRTHKWKCWSRLDRDENRGNETSINVYCAVDMFQIQCCSALPASHPFALSVPPHWAIHMNVMYIYSNLFSYRTSPNIRIQTFSGFSVIFVFFFFFFRSVRSSVRLRITHDCRICHTGPSAISFDEKNTEFYLQEH